MKSILLAVMALLSLSAQAKTKKPKPAFAKGDFTLIAGTAYPDVVGYRGWNPALIFTAAAEYQASPRFTFGLQYLFSQSMSPWLRRTTTVNGSPYTFEYKWTITAHLIMLTSEYALLNRGKTELSMGIALGYSPRPSVSTQFSDNVDHLNIVASPRENGLIGASIRLITAKIKLTNNFGVCGGIRYGNEGLFSLGVHYTFKGNK